jgi:hypothetical protein
MTTSSKAAIYKLLRCFPFTIIDDRSGTVGAARRQIVVAIERPPETFLSATQGFASQYKKKLPAIQAKSFVHPGISAHDDVKFLIAVT